MAAQPPKKYNYGELDKIRERLGPISKEEAKKMAKILGGEIGVEKGQPDLKKQPKSFSNLNRRKSDQFKQGKPISKLPPQQLTGVNRPIQKKISQQKKKKARMGYADRIRLDFMAAQTPYQVKSMGSAIGSLFSFLQNQDFINPDFIKNADVFFFGHIQKLVISIRKLMKFDNQEVRSTLTNIPVVLDILNIIKNWDLTGIHEELSILQKNPNNIPIAKLKNLCLKTLTPIIRLMDLQPSYHINISLKKLYDINILIAGPLSTRQEEIKKLYYITQNEINNVFFGIKQRFFPIIIKHISNHFVPYERFFQDMRTAILDFFSLEPDMIIAPPAKMQVKDIKPEKIPIIEPVQQTIKKTAIPSEVRSGMEVLDQFFPSAGWNRLNEYPDLYAYFQPIYNLPRGFNLLPPNEPLQQITFLLLILQDLFYGFRAIRFGKLKQDNGEIQKIDQIIDNLLNTWNLFFDQIITRKYIPKLNEYCNQMERNPNYDKTPHAAKIREDLYWIKRLYFLPHLDMAWVKRLEPNESIKQLPLFKVVENLIQVLINIAIDMDLSEREKKQSQLILNPWQDYTFAIENFVSKRLKAILKKGTSVSLKQKANSNYNFIMYTLAILLVLDYLINNKDSFFYYDKTPPHVFRSINNSKKFPEYKVNLLNPQAIFNQQKQAQNNMDLDFNTIWQSIKQDKLTSLNNYLTLKEHLDNVVNRFLKTNEPFTVIYLDIIGFTAFNVKKGRTIANNLLKNIALKILKTIRQFKDIPFRLENDDFFIILSNTNQNQAIILAKRLLTIIKNIPLSIIILQFIKAWNIEKLIAVTKSISKQAKKFKSSAIIVYNPLNRTVKKISMNK